MDHHNGSNSRMMWIMMLGCAIPVLFLLFSGSLPASPVSWILIVAVVAMTGIHIRGMLKSHGNSGEPSAHDDSEHSHNPDKHP